MDRFLMKLGMWIVFSILKLARSLLNLIFDIANINFIEQDVIGTVLTRVYIIVGVLMLFKIVISCVQYLINPDKSEDKEGGFGAIIKRALISIALLSLVPTMFNFAKTAQNVILDALPKVILGQENNYNVDNIGDNITYTTALSFFGYTSDACNDGSIAGLGKENSNPMISSIDDVLNNASIIAATECNGGKRYEFSFLSFLVGLATSIFLVVMFVEMVFDVGVRTIKFAFLELIAPIPIASYIDPKTSKKSFDSWVQNSLTVYADLFIRLGVIYLVLHFFDLLFPSFVSDYTLNDGVTRIDGMRANLVNVAIILSLFMFAKNAPKFICDVFGIKDGGSISDMFKLNKLRSAGALPLAGLTAGIGAARNKHAWGKGVFRSVAGGLRAAAAATARGTYGMLSGQKPGEIFSGSRDKAIAAANKRYEFHARSGGTSKSRVGRTIHRAGVRISEGWDHFTGVTTGAERISQEKEYFQNLLSLKTNEKKNALAKANALNGFVDNDLTISATSDNVINLPNGHSYNNYRAFMDELNSLEAIPAGSRTAVQSARYSELSADRRAIETYASQVTLKNGHSYDSYSDFLQELNGLEQIPFNDRTPDQKDRLNQLMQDKDMVEKFMIRNQSFIALTRPDKDIGNYSSIAADVTKIVRTGQPDDVAQFLKNIGGGDAAIGQAIADALEKQIPLTRDQAIRLNDYIAGDLESHAQKGISDATARERTIPKKN